MTAKKLTSNSIAASRSPRITARLDDSFNGEGLHPGLEKRLWWIDPRDVRNTQSESSPMSALQNAYSQGLARSLESQGVERNEPFYGGVMEEEGKTSVFVVTGNARLKAILMAIEQGCPVHPIPVLLDVRSSDALLALAAPATLS